MKIMHIGQMIGGLDVYIRNTIMYTEDGFDYVIVHGEKDNSKPVVKHGKPIREHRIRLHRELNLLWDIVALIQAVILIRKECPDIIHCHSAKGGFVGRIAGWLTGTRTYYTPHAFSFLCTDSKAKRWVYLLLERIARRNSCLLACSESEWELGIKVVHYKEEKALVWHNAVPDIEINKEKEEKYICCIGRPSYQKNTMLLIEVVRGVKERHPEVKFYLIGVGYYSPDLEETKRRISEYGLEDAFEMLPWLDQRATHEYVGKSMMYLTVARYEGLPLAVIEAMAMGKPIVASNVVGNMDCVRDGVNGYLLALNADEFVDRICYLIEHNAERQRMGIRSRKRFEEDFLINNRIRMLESIYKS